MPYGTSRRAGVDSWSANAPAEIVKHLDYCPESLKEIERYILEKYNKENLGDSENKIEIDALVSYYGETIRRNIPNSTWHIELDDETDAYYNSPAVKPPIGLHIGLYYVLKRIIHKKTGTFLYNRYIKTIKKNNLEV